MLKIFQEQIGTLEQSEAFLKNVSGIFSKIHDVWDPIPAERIERFSVGKTLQLGAAEWEVHYFPGHSITQTCFYQPEHKYLLSADMLLKRTATPVIDVNPDNPTERIKSLSQMLDSYERLSQMDINKVFPGHYEPFEEAQAVIQNQVRRIHSRKMQCYELIKMGHTSLLELFEKMYKNPWNLAALAMLIGYLDVLIEEEKVELKHQAGYFRYLPIEQKIENHI